MITANGVIEYVSTNELDKFIKNQSQFLKKWNICFRI